MKKLPRKFRITVKYDPTHSDWCAVFVGPEDELTSFDTNPAQAIQTIVSILKRDYSNEPAIED